MAETNETHIVEIPVDSQTNHQIPNFAASPSPIQHHPLTEISKSPGHLLLLKLLQREEDRIACRSGIKETRLDSLKRKAFALSSLFFAFHGLSLTLVFTSSITQVDGKACKNWLVPCGLSLLTSVVLVWAIEVQVCEYWKESRGLQRERGDGRAVARLVQELRMKGVSFDLSKEPDFSRRMKSSSVEIEWKPLRCLKENLVGFCLVGFSGLVVSACKLILCY